MSLAMAMAAAIAVRMIGSPRSNVAGFIAARAYAAANALSCPSIARSSSNVGSGSATSIQYFDGNHRFI
jgi:hypothetical protein